VTGIANQRECRSGIRRITSTSSSHDAPRAGSGTDAHRADF
jgi:hypothetical protein